MFHARRTDTYLPHAIYLARIVFIRLSTFLVYFHRLINYLHIYLIHRFFRSLSLVYAFACRTHNRTEKSTYAYRCVMRSSFSSHASPLSLLPSRTHPYGRVQPNERRFRHLLVVRRCSSSMLTRFCRQQRRRRAKNTRLALVFKPTHVRLTSVMQESGACLHVVDCSSMKAESVDQAMS